MSASVNSSKQRIGALLVKEFLQLRRDKQLLRIILIGPVIQLFLFGFAINMDVVDIPMAVCDMDHSAQSRAFVERLSESGYFPVVAHVERASAVGPLLDAGDASLAVTIPVGFGKKIAAGIAAPVQAIVDGSESNAGTMGLSYATIIAAEYSQSVLLERFSRVGAGSHALAQISPEIRVWYNPELKSRNYLVPGILGMLLLTTTAMLTSLGIVKERERGTMEQLIVTPIRPLEIILGKLIPFLVIGIVDLIIAIAGVVLVLGVPLHGSFWLLFALSIIFITTTLGLGLFVSTISRTQQQAMMTSMFFVMMPMNFLSGFIFPIENMPTVIQWVTYFLPLRYYFEIIRGIFLRGVGIEILWPQTLALFAFGVLILGLSAMRFRKRLA